MIIYLHGFASSGRSRKGQQLRSWLAPEPVLTPTYSQDPATAVGFLQGFIRDALTESTPAPLLLIGSSLGGYYAQYLAQHFRCGAVLINPALDPVAVLAGHLGENRIYQTGEGFTFERSQLQALRRFDIVDPCRDPVPTLLLVDRGDQVVDATMAIRKYAGCGELRIFAGGGHEFTHLPESVGAIEDLYRRLPPQSSTP